MGVGRPDAGALGRRLCAGEPSGVVTSVFGPLLPIERSAACTILSRSQRWPEVGRSAGGPSNSDSTSRPSQPHLFRAGLPCPISRLSPSRGRRPCHARGPSFRPHHRRAKALRRHLASHRRRLVRSPRIERVFTDRRARNVGSDPRARRGGGKHAGNGIPRFTRHARFPAGARARSSRSGPAHAKHGDLVVWAAAGEGKGSGRVPRDLDRASVFGSLP